MALSAAGGSGKIERLSSIDAQLRLLVPGKLSDDDKLIEYDALLLDRFLDVLQGLHGDDLREMVSFFNRSISHRIQSILTPVSTLDLYCASSRHVALLNAGVGLSLALSPHGG
jgi:hypothetical protein